MFLLTLHLFQKHCLCRTGVRTYIISDTSPYLLLTVKLSLLAFFSQVFIF